MILPWERNTGSGKIDSNMARISDILGRYFERPCVYLAEQIQFHQVISKQIFDGNAAGLAAKIQLARLKQRVGIK